MLRRHEPTREVKAVGGIGIKCGKGVLLPLSDYGRDGAPITYKAWVCSNPECGFNIRIDNGEISFGRTVGQSQK